MIKASRRAWVGTALVAVGIANCAFLWHRYETRHRPEFGVPEQRARIDGIIETLQSESFNESVSKLVDEQFYYYPGYYSARKFDQVNLEQVLSNRRCLKVFSELEELPISDREEECRRIFRSVFDDHAKLIRDAISRLKASLPSNSTQSSHGTQLALATSLLATAKYGATEDLQLQVAAIEDFEDEINNKLELLEGSSVGRLISPWAQMLSVPDRRLVMNAVCVHGQRPDVASNSNRIKKICAGLVVTEIPLAHWSAKITWFDVPRRIENLPVDESSGITIYILYGWPGDSFYDSDKQVALIRELKEALALSKSGKTWRE
jgi:hypothetical protein